MLRRANTERSSTIDRLVTDGSAASGFRHRSVPAHKERQQQGKQKLQAHQRGEAVSTYKSINLLAAAAEDE